MIENVTQKSAIYTRLSHDIKSSSSLSEAGIQATIILPAFNEALALPTVLHDLTSVVDNNYQILVIDDGSTDDTAAIAQQYQCEVIQHLTNYGKGVAVRTGIRHARGELVIVMDADATYPASAIPELVELLKKNDLVRCTRLTNSENMPSINKAGNWIFDRLLVNVIGLDGVDQFSGLYGLHKCHFMEMDLDADGFDLEVEINMKAKVHGLSVATFPIEYQNRIGEKKLHPFRDGWQILRQILFLILVHNPVTMFILPGLLVTGLGIFGATLLRGHAIVTPFFGLDIHSFILASFSILTGFQLVIFGLAAALYSIEAGLRPKPWLIWISSLPVRLSMALTGLLMAFLGFLDVIEMIYGWISADAGPFKQTQGLVLSVTLMIGGLQLLSAAMFVSIFSGRFRKKVKQQSQPQISFPYDPQTSGLYHSR